MVVFFDEYHILIPLRIFTFWIFQFHVIFFIGDDNKAIMNCIKMENEIIIDIETNNRLSDVDDLHDGFESICVLVK